MKCVLKDYHNFTGSFSYGPNINVHLPSIGGIHLGHIRLRSTIDAELGLSVSASDIVFTAGGGFDFEGVSRHVGPVKLDADISGLTAVLKAMEEWIIHNSEKIFGDLIHDASKWAKCIYSDAILPAEKGVAYVVSAFRHSFKKDIKEVGNLLKGSHYALNAVGGALKREYNAAANDVAGVMVTAYKASQKEVTGALHDVGYGADEITHALVGNFNASEKDVAVALKGVGYGAEETTKAITGFFKGTAPDALQNTLKDVGYSANEVSSAFKSIGGTFSNYASKAENDVKHYANPKNW